MALLIRLPAFSCVHYRDGGCIAGLKEDFLSYQNARCKMHTHADRAFDELLDRAEAFTEPIGPLRFVSVWEKRLAALCDNFVCSDRIPGADPLVSCAHLVDDLCRKRLPDCPGRCSRYSEAES